MERYLRDRLGKEGFGQVSEARSQAMSAVRGKNNKSTERRLRMELVRRGIRGWTLHASALPGKPDFWFPSVGLAVFVDGCFWHGCPLCGHIPRTNRDFWAAKIARNHERDSKVNTLLRGLGVRALRFWECELRGDGLKAAMASVDTAVRSGRTRRRGKG